MGARTDKTIDSAIGATGTACGVGLAMVVVGWVANMPILNKIGTWLAMPAICLGLAFLGIVTFGSIVTMPFAIARAIVRAARGEWPLL